MELRKATTAISACALILAMTAATFGGNIIHVAAAGNDASDGLTWATSKKTVTAGLTAAVAGDQVWVARGTYVELITLKDGVGLYGGFAGTEAILAERLAFPRTNPDANETVLDGNKVGSVVTSPSGVTAAARIDGFTVRNGRADSGGGIRCYWSSPTISNNFIMGNTAVTAGGGISCEYSASVISNNTIAANVVRSELTSILSRGGGVFCDYGSPVIANNTILGNAAGVYGSGIYCRGALLAVSSNTIVGNTTQYDFGVITCTSGTLEFSNNIIAFNSSGIYRGGSAAVTIVLRNNDVYSNGKFDYSGVSASPTDVSVDPRLAAAEYGEVHLLADSPCIDAGDDQAAQSGWVDMDGQPRIQGAHIDIGADEFDGTAPSAFQPAIVRVHPAGNDANSGTSWDLAKKTVQAGIDAASVRGGEVWVAAGTYNERIALRPFVHVYGGFVGSETTREARQFAANVTVLDGQAGGTVVSATVCGYRISTIDGFTIRNGKAGSGGGIYCDHSSPAISNNVITANSGGGIVCRYAGPMISGNMISENNSDQYGGGIHCYCAWPTIAGNTIARNAGQRGGGGVSCELSSAMIIRNIIVASSMGGGISCCAESSVTILGNRIEGNRDGGITCGDGCLGTIANNWIIGNSSAGYGGGICCSGPSLAVLNNTILGNSAIGGGGMACAIFTPVSNNIVAFNSSGVFDSSVFYSPGTARPPILRNNDVYGNQDFDYSRTLSMGAGDMSVDPRFVATEFGQPHLMPGSPCIDAGDDGMVLTDSVDADGQQRIQGLHVDIGADEYDGTVPPVFQPAVLRVSPAGNDDNDGASWAQAKKTVQAGIEAAFVHGGEVWVAAGSYKELVTLRPFVHVYGGFAGAEATRSERNWARSITILDGNSAGSVVNASVCGYRVSTIDGFTIRNGKANSGGGIYCSSGAPTISNNTITGCSATSSGGAIYCSAASPLIATNTITGNTAKYGGAILCLNISPATILNNTIVGNSATSAGGGIYGEGRSPSVLNNIVAFNSSGIRLSTSAASPAVLRNNDVFGNTAYDYSGCSAGTGDISADPLFVARQAGNYHLRSGSPCIDAGDDTAVLPGALDVDGSPRIQGVHVDIGADEFMPGDFSNDNRVDMADFVLFKVCFSGSTIPCADGCRDKDLDGDNDVDQSDFGLFQLFLGE